jgi:hypothetical protein
MAELSMTNHQAAADLALQVWDVLGNDPDAPDKDALRSAAVGCLKETWKAPRPALVDAARDVAFAVIERKTFAVEPLDVEELGRHVSALDAAIKGSKWQGRHISTRSASCATDCQIRRRSTD